MQYVNALGRARFVRMLFGLLQGLILLEPLFIFAVILFFVVKRDDGNVVLPPFVWMVLAGMALMGLIMFFVVRYVFRRMYSTTIEVSRDGLRHLRPGKERMILWRDVRDVQRVNYGKGQSALQLVTPDTRYTLTPYLVPDTPGAPQLKMGFGKMCWKYPDGHEESCDLEHSFALKIVREHAPSALR